MNLGRYDNYPIQTFRGFLFARTDLERIAAGAELNLPEFASVSQVQRIIESPETPDQVSANGSRRGAISLVSIAGMREIH